jgi:hypothetical protein
MNGSNNHAWTRGQKTVHSGGVGATSKAVAMPGSYADDKKAMVEDASLSPSKHAAGSAYVTPTKAGNKSGACRWEGHVQHVLAYCKW